MDPGIRPAPMREAWDSLKGGGDIKGNFKEGNLNINALREKNRYEERAKLGI